MSFSTAYKLMLERFAARFSDNPAYVEEFALPLWQFGMSGGIQASSLLRRLLFQAG